MLLEDESMEEREALARPVHEHVHMIETGLAGLPVLSCACHQFVPRL